MKGRLLANFSNKENGGKGWVITLISHILFISEIFQISLVIKNHQNLTFSFVSKLRYDCVHGKALSNTHFMIIKILKKQQS